MTIIREKDEQGYEPTPDQALAHKERVLVAALGSMKRYAMLLLHLRGFTMGEIGEAWGVSRQAVDKELSAILAIVKELGKEKGRFG